MPISILATTNPPRPAQDFHPTKRTLLDALRER